MLKKKFLQEDIVLNEKEKQDLDTEVTEADDYTGEGLSGIIGANVTQQQNGQTVKAKITKRAIRPDGKHMGKYNYNSILDSRKYEVGLLDEVVDKY